MNDDEFHRLAMTAQAHDDHRRRLARIIGGSFPETLARVDREHAEILELLHRVLVGNVTEAIVAAIAVARRLPNHAGAFAMVRETLARAAMLDPRPALIQVEEAKGEWLCRCGPGPEPDKYRGDINPSYVSGCARCGMRRP